MLALLAATSTNLMTLLCCLHYQARLTNLPYIKMVTIGCAAGIQTITITKINNVTMKQAKIE